VIEEVKVAASPKKDGLEINMIEQAIIVKMDTDDKMNLQNPWLA